MPESDLLTADEAAKLLRIGWRTFDAHVARGDIAYIAVGMGLKRVRKRFDPEDIARFRDRQRRVEYQPDPVPAGCVQRSTGTGSIDFRALLEERRALRRKAKNKAQKA